MAECFCGCGQRVGFTSRGMNKQGKRTVGLLRKIETARHAIEDDAEPEVTALFSQLARDGEMYVTFWSDAVHDIYLPPPAEARAIKEEWEAWGRVGMRALEQFTLVPIKRGFLSVVKGEV